MVQPSTQSATASASQEMAFSATEEKIAQFMGMAANKLLGPMLQMMQQVFGDNPQFQQIAQALNSMGISPVGNDGQPGNAPQASVQPPAVGAGADRGAAVQPT